MYIANIRGISKLIRRNPQLLSVATTNLSHQLFHKIGGSRLHGWSHPPEVINAFVTDICNLGCRECHYGFSDKPGFSLNQVGHMEVSIFNKFMDEISGRPVVSFTGGEPLLHPDVTEFIASAKDKDRLCTLTTNGWFLANRAQELSEAGLDILIVSVDGPRETHNAIRGKNSYEHLSLGLESVLKQPKRPIVFVSLAISDINFDQLIPTYKLAKNWGVDGLNFNHLWMHTDKMVQKLDAQFSLFPVDHVEWEVNNEAIDVDYLADCLEIIRDLSRGGKMIVMESPYLNRQEIINWYREPEKPVKHETVRCGWIRMKLWADGKVKPCRDWEVGDITEIHAKDIWNGKQYREFRHILTTRGMLPICARCCFMAHR